MASPVRPAIPVPLVVTSSTTLPEPVVRNPPRRSLSDSRRPPPQLPRGRKPPRPAQPSQPSRAAPPAYRRNVWHFTPLPPRPGFRGRGGSGGPSRDDAYCTFYPSFGYYRQGGPDAPFSPIGRLPNSFRPARKILKSSTGIYVEKKASEEEEGENDDSDILGSPRDVARFLPTRSGASGPSGRPMVNPYDLRGIALRSGNGHLFRKVPKPPTQATVEVDDELDDFDDVDGLSGEENEDVPDEAEREQAQRRSRRVVYPSAVAAPPELRRLRRGNLGPRIPRMSLSERFRHVTDPDGDAVMFSSPIEGPDVKLRAAAELVHLRAPRNILSSANRLVVGTPHSDGDDMDSDIDSHLSGVSDSDSGSEGMRRGRRSKQRRRPRRRDVRDWRRRERRPDRRVSRRSARSRSRPRRQRQRQRRPRRYYEDEDHSDSYDDDDYSRSRSRSRSRSPLRRQSRSRRRVPPTVAVPVPLHAAPRGPVPVPVPVPVRARVRARARAAPLQVQVPVAMMHRQPAMRGRGPQRLPTGQRGDPLIVEDAFAGDGSGSNTAEGGTGGDDDEEEAYPDIFINTMGWGGGDPVRVWEEPNVKREVLDEAEREALARRNILGIPAHAANTGQRPAPTHRTVHPVPVPVSIPQAQNATGNTNTPVLLSRQELEWVMANRQRLGAHEATAGRLDVVFQ